MTGSPALNTLADATRSVRDPTGTYSSVTSCFVFSPGVWCVAARNARGNGAVQKLGAVAEGLLRASLLVADGTRHDQVLWAWLEEDWRRGRQAGVEASAWVH